ncbi:DUF397 domain-containing protein [Pseudonocardia spinosispora]|uniref:DUF397 domain-containing protein n=1 Tax=Pseudonocardia spinosispora TaxID=103441 RepID=UPI000426DDC6|nr:DUF397 domain-containing protein [Pseudonocardia spinosispora]
MAEALSRASAWRKSAYSKRADDCVEVSTEVSGWVGVRDSKLASTSPILAFTASQWGSFVRGLGA